MTAIDRAALIEAAAKAVRAEECERLQSKNLPPLLAWHEMLPAARINRKYSIETALPVIAREMLAPLRELHRGKHLDDGTDPSGPWCLVCLELDPCRTMEMLDQIEADVKGDER